MTSVQRPRLAEERCLGTVCGMSRKRLMACASRRSPRCGCVGRRQVEWQRGDLQVNVIRSTTERRAHGGDLELEPEGHVTVLGRE